MKILGLAYGYHDSSATLVVDGDVVAAAQEERFNRSKNYPGFPICAINYCLQAGDLTAPDLDAVAFYEKPYLKFYRVLNSHVAAWPFSLGNFLRTMPGWLSERLVTPMVLEAEIGYKGRVLFVPHHVSHAASTFLASPFEEAAILVSDGVGEVATMSWGTGRNKTVEVRQELRFPHSLGLVYSAVTTYLVFDANGGEGKTMGLADWGRPTLVDAFRKVIDVKPDGSFRIDTRYLDFVSGRTMYNRSFVDLFGPPRNKGEEITDRHRDIAASLQLIAEETLLNAVRHVQKQTGLRRLCGAGGSFLNCPTNSRILSETDFDELFVQPAAGDAGGSLGAALYAGTNLLGGERRFVMRRAQLGPSFSADEIRRCLLANGARFEEMGDDHLVDFVADRVAQGAIVGWFQGRLEFGPRALGSRSILADPRHPDMKDILNDKVKHRESFRPYGVAILMEEATRSFHWEDRESPFMLLVAKAREGTREKVPSAIHVGNTCRLQTVTPEDGLYFRVVEAFQRKTGIGMIINTSFNDNTEPIVCTPADAYACFAKTRMDYLVLGNCVVRKGDAE